MEAYRQIENMETDLSEFFKTNNADIIMWEFHHAPLELQISVGGDEDWVVVLKKDFYENKYIPFLEQSNTSTGYSSIHKFLWNEFVILIGCHAWLKK